MLPFLRFKWPEMRSVAHDLIARIHAGHTHASFAIPVTDFVSVFAPGADQRELAKLDARGSIRFTADMPDGGTFVLAEGARALFDLRREGLVMRVPARMSGRYTVRPQAFRIEFQAGEELEGCKRVVLLVCNRLVSVDVSTERVEVRSHRRIFDLTVEF